MELDREQVLERFLLYSGEDEETASPERKALWEALCEGGAKWAEAQAGPGAAGWEESLVGLAAAQAFYHLVLADGALLPGSLSTPEVKLDWAAREEKARALAQDTPCLILDEPTNHLDIKYQLQLMDIVKGLDRTVIAAIHDLNIAAMYCDRLYALKDGEIVAVGTPGEVLTPDFIRRVYEVDARTFTDETGQLHILYHPARRAAGR